MDYTLLAILTGGRLTEIHLIEIVFYQLIKIFDTFHLIEFLKPNLTWPNLT